MEHTIAINPDLAEIREVRAWLEERLTARALQEDLIADMALVTEEVLANVIDYNAPGQGAKIEVELRLSPQRLELVFLDSGIPFNPLEEIANPDLSADAEEREAGGFGFFLVRELTDQVAYQREGGRNRLSVFRDLKESG